MKGREMRYELGKAIYTRIGFQKEKWTEDVADRLKKGFEEGKILEKLGYSPRVAVKKSWCTRMKELLKVCVDTKTDGFKEISDYGVESHLELNYKEDDKIELREILFLFFYLIECKQCENKYLVLFKRMIEAAEIAYELERYEDMNTAILYFVIKKELGFDRWKELLKDWHENEKENWSGNLSIIRQNNITDLTYKTINNMLKNGVEGEIALLEAEKIHERKTRLSLQYIKNTMEDVFLNPELNDKNKIREIFDSSIIQHILNVQIRRQWYFFRMISTIVHNQIEDIVSCLNDLRNCQDRQRKKEYEKMLSDMLHFFWGEKEKEETERNGHPFHIGDKNWGEVATHLNYLENINIQNIKEDLMNSRITVGKICAAFNTYFDGMKMDNARKESPGAIARFRERYQYYIQRFNIGREETKEVEVSLWLEEMQEFLVQEERECLYSYLIPYDYRDAVEAYLTRHSLPDKLPDISDSRSLEEDRAFDDSDGITAFFQEILGCSEEQKDRIFNIAKNEGISKAKEEFLALGKPKGLSEKFLKYVWKKWADDFYPVKQYPRFGETKIRNLFCKDHEVSRELLLLTVLLKKVIVGGTVQKKSAIIRMLTNCRLSPEFADTVFEKYVEAAFDDMNKEDNGKNTYEERYRRRASRMRILNEQSLEMELSYLKGIYDKDGHLVERGTAVFADAFFGRRIE